MPTPIYKVTHWASSGEWLSHTDKPLHLQTVHIPGHTPDSLAIWDEEEAHLYVGDTFYLRGKSDAPIIFPKEGDFKKYLFSLQILWSFTWQQNIGDGGGSDKRVKIGCGHTTSAVDGEELVSVVRSLCNGILRGTVPIVKSVFKRGEIYDTWQTDTGLLSTCSLIAPRRIVEDARSSTKGLEGHDVEPFHDLHIEIRTAGSL
jgi:hypothetical protein